MKKLLLLLVFIIFVSCNNKPDTSEFDTQIKKLKEQIGVLEQDLIKADTQTKRAIGLAEHFRNLYWEERVKVDSLENIK